MSQVILAEYGRAKTVNFDLYEVDGVDFRVDAVDAGADCDIMKDEGDEGTATNDFADEGRGYSLVLTAVEMQAARVVVYVTDEATKAWLDKHIYIETYGHPSSAHPFMTPYWANGAVNDGSASSTVWTFDGFTEATADHVIGSELTFTSGANAGQCQTVVDFTSTVITVDPPFLAAPADNDEFVLRAKPQTTAGITLAPSVGLVLADTGELQTDWANGGRLDLLLDALQTDLDNATDGLGALKTLIDTVNTDLSNGTDGLGALKTLIDTVNTDLSNGTDGLGALKTLIDALNDAPAVTAATIADSVWDEAVAGHVAAGSFGKTDADILADSNELQGDWVNGGRLDLIIDAINVIATDWTNGGRLDLLIDAIQTDLDNGTDGLGALKTLIDALNDLSAANINTEVDSAWTTQMADSVPADGTISTREQALYAILQMLTEFAISSTTMTVKKVDGSTTLMTLTLDDDTNPTSLTRAT